MDSLDSDVLVLLTEQLLDARDVHAFAQTCKRCRSASSPTLVGMQRSHELQASVQDILEIAMATTITKIYVHPVFPQCSEDDHPDLKLAIRVARAALESKSFAIVGVDSSDRLCIFTRHALQGSCEIILQRMSSQFSDGPPINVERVAQMDEAGNVPIYVCHDDKTHEVLLPRKLAHDLFQCANSPHLRKFYRTHRQVREDNAHDRASRRKLLRTE